MPTIDVPSTPANQAQVQQLLAQYADVLNRIGRYQAIVAGTRLDLTPLVRPVDFLRASPSATAADANDFLNFLAAHPPQAMVDQFARHDGGVGRPAGTFAGQLDAALRNPAATLPDVFQVLNSAFAQVHRDYLPTLFRDVILPWFFGREPDGRVLAITVTGEGHQYEFILRQLVAMSLFGFDALRDGAAQRKPYMDLLLSLDGRIEHVAKLALQYNAPFVDGFCLRGIFTVFVFLPSVSVHRCSVRGTSVFDLLAPYSSVSAAPDVFTEDGQQDTVRAIHPQRTASQADTWLRYWLERANATLDRLYNLGLAADASGAVSVGNYLRGILQFERIFFEVTWACSMLDQFLRKIVTYAVLDKITSFMGNAWGAGGTEKFVRALSPQFLIDRLPQLFANPELRAAARIGCGPSTPTCMRATACTFSPTLLQGGNIDLAASYAHLAECASFPAAARCSPRPPTWVRSSAPSATRTTASPT